MSTRTTLGALCEVVTKGTTPTTLGKSFQEAGINFVKVESIDADGGFIPDKFAKIDEETHSLLGRSILKEGDILFSIAGAIGRTAIARKAILPANTNQAIAVLRCIPDKVERKWLYYYLRSSAFQNFSLGHVVQTAQANVSLGVLKAAPITLPPREHQRRIAFILSAYDDLIDNNTRRIAILEEMARRIYEEWFVRFRFPGHERVKMVESELGLIPEGWEVTNLDSVSDYINRGLTPKYDDTAGGLVINQKCIRGQKLSYELARKQSKPIPVDKRIRYGDVLINSTGVGTLGRVAQVLDERSNCTADTHVTIVRPGERVTTHFFGMALLALEQYFEQQGVGATGQTELGRSRVAETAFTLPPHALQERFDELVVPMRLLAIKLATKSTNLRTTRDLLLPKLISGELDVSTLPEPETIAA